MFDPNKFRIPMEEVGKMVQSCLNAAVNAFEMYATNPSYYEEEDSVYVDDIDYSKAEDFGVTQDFIEKFMSQTSNYNPNMGFIMNLIQATDLGAKAFGFIDVPDKVTDGTAILSGADAVKYCINNISSEDQEKVKDRLITLFNLGNLNKLYEDLEDMSVPEMVTVFSAPKMLELTLLIGLPIQALFDYNFYDWCGRV